MGTNQSSAQDQGGQEVKAAEVRTCYYKLLEVDKKATEEEIKKAYRKKALELHPDRNYGNVENTTKRFAEVQSAYEVLSDPQERAWYDSHRDAILRNEDTQGDVHYENDIRVTTADDITKMFMTFDGHLDYSDSQRGFYNTFSTLFDTLAQEELAACERQGLEPVEYPSFGSSKDTYESSVKTFYAAWMNFTTKKDFSWKEIHRYSAAPDRRVRRMMEKENKRCREEHIREFTEAVRAIAAFVRKRDPRYTPSKQSEADRQMALREIAAAQAAKSRAANEAKLRQDTIRLWANTERQSGNEDDSDEEDDKEAMEHFECVVCKKIFKSENQWEAHEKSKKHVKAVQQIRRRMRADEEALGLDAFDKQLNVESRKLSDMEEDGLAHPSAQTRFTSSQKPTVDHQEMDAPPLSTSDMDDTLGPSVILAPTCEDVTEEVSRNGSLDVPVTSPNLSQAADLSNDIEDIFQGIHSATLTEDDSSSTPLRLGKAKAKRAKKAAKVTAGAVDSEHEFKCATCHASFPSKTRLFSHIKDLGHAQPLGKGKTLQGKNGHRK